MTLSSKRKILFIASNVGVPWGGSEVLWYLVAKFFLQNHYQVGISIKRWDPTPSHVKELQRLGGEFFFRNDSLLSLRYKVINRFLPYHLQVKRGSNKLLKSFSPDLAVISQGDNRGGIEWMDWCKGNNIKYVTITQAVNESNWPNNKLAIKMKNAYKLAVKNYFVSKANLRITQVQIASDLKNSKVICNPFNVLYNEPLEYPESKDWYLLANVARYEFQAKGQDILLEVMNDEKWRNRNLFVNFYGKGIHAEQLIRLIKYFNITNCSVNGHIDTLEIWKQNHALALPSRYEGLPLALVEAMLSGRFGIVTNVSGNAEVVLDNENGFIAAAPKPEYFDEALERAWNRRDEWKSIGLKAESYIKSIVPEDPVQILYNELCELVHKA